MVGDPVTQKKVPLFQFMFMIDGPFVGTLIDSRLGQNANAQKSIQAFSARAKAYPPFQNCHYMYKFTLKYRWVLITVMILK